MRVLFLIQHLLHLVVIRDVRNLIDDLLAELDLGDLLVFIIDQPDQLIGVHSDREVVDIKASGVLLEVDLVIATGQVAHDVAEAVSIVEEARVDELELF